MLDAMRKQRGLDPVVLKSRFVAIVLVFMFWGVGRSRLDHVEVAALVNDEPIIRSGVRPRVSRAAATDRTCGSQAPPAELLRGQVLDQLIDLRAARSGSRDASA